MRNRVNVNLNLNNIAPCGKCGTAKTVVRIPGRTQVFCPKCDKA